MEDKEFLTEFIYLYQSMLCLWKIKCKDYSNRIIKNSCYDFLVEKLKERFPEATREMAVKKINNLRSSYRREMKKTKDSLKSGAGADEEYVSTLWYYDLLLFLHDQEEHAVGRNTMDDGNIALEQSERRPKKRKTTEEDQLIKFACEKLEASSKQPDSLAESWSSQYNEMNAVQKVIARKIISDVLFHGCLGNLQISHTVEIQNILNDRVTPNPIPAPGPSNYAFPSYAMPTPHFTYPQQVRVVNYQSPPSSSVRSGSSTPQIIIDNPEYIVETSSQESSFHLPTNYRSQQQ